MDALAQAIPLMPAGIIPGGEIQARVDPPGELPRSSRLDHVGPTHRVGAERPAQTRDRGIRGYGIAKGIPMIGGQTTHVAKIERDGQRILIPHRFTGIEIESREHDVVPLRDARVNAQPDEGVVRVRVDDDAAMLIPLPGVLFALCIARLRKDIARAPRDP